MTCLEFDRDDCPGVDVDQMWEYVTDDDGMDAVMRPIAVREAVRAVTTDGSFYCPSPNPWGWLAYRDAHTGRWSAHDTRAKHGPCIFGEVCERGLP